MRKPEAINKLDFMYNIFRLEGIKVWKEDMPTLMKRITVRGININGVIKTDNIFKAWNYISSTPLPQLDLEFVKQINKLVEFGMYGWHDYEGTLRNIPVRISGTEWRPAMPDENKAAEDIKALSTIPDVLDRAIETLMYLMKAQLFRDGNKRTAQMTACAILYNTGYVISIPQARQNEFCRVLIMYYESEEKKQSLKNFLLSQAVFKREDF